MFRKAYPIPINGGQALKLVPIGDIHFDTDECDRDRLADLVVWARREEDAGHLERGTIKRYLVGSGSFQRAYLPGHAGYAEKGGLVPSDLGVVVINISVVERKGRYRVDFHASV